MELFATNGNPIPPEPIVSVAQTDDGVRLRVARWPVRDPRGTVLVAMGRGEFVELYFEVVRELLARSFDVVVFEWRGQGLSDRGTPAKRGGAGFAAYARDLDAVEAQILRMFAPRPWFALGHSMGATALLEQAHAGTSPFQRLVLTAPMIRLALPGYVGKRLVVRAMNAAGLGGWTIPGGSRRSPLLRRFEGNLLTGDRRQHEKLTAALAQLPHMRIGSPTVGWLAGALRVTDRFEDARYPVATLTPILIVAAGADRIVDTPATERFAIRLKAGRCLTLPEARHHILLERRMVTAQFWAAFDAFVPGDAHDRPAAEPPARRPSQRWWRRILRPATAPGDPRAAVP